MLALMFCNSTAQCWPRSWSLLLKVFASAKQKIDKWGPKYRAIRLYKFWPAKFKHANKKEYENKGDFLCNFIIVWGYIFVVVLFLLWLPLETFTYHFVSLMLLLFRLCPMITNHSNILPSIHPSNQPKFLGQPSITQSCYLSFYYIVNLPKEKKWSGKFELWKKQNNGTNDDYDENKCSQSDLKWPNRRRICLYFQFQKTANFK